MRLVYFSPVSWYSFAQRPHKFVEWFHKQTGGEALWIEPYPTRLPRWSDAKSLRHKVGHMSTQRPTWLTVARPVCLPIEPLMGLAQLNSWLWTDCVAEIKGFAARGHCILGIGKPSQLALQLLRSQHFHSSFYDAMDDFSAFFSGLSRVAMARTEQAIANSVTHILTSSTPLFQRWSQDNKRPHMARNGLDPLVLPTQVSSPMHKTETILGYVGTLGDWFDWDWVIALARIAPSCRVLLIGPVFKSPAQKLPPNIELRGPLQHAQALQAMSLFDIGLIPFQLSRLTASVDPIKFYEYRALGLPVISTKFGEMAHRQKEAGTFIFDPRDPLHALVGLLDAAARYQSNAQEKSAFIEANSWEARFTPLRPLFSD